MTSLTITLVITLVLVWFLLHSAAYAMAVLLVNEERQRAGSNNVENLSLS